MILCSVGDDESEDERQDKSEDKSEDDGEDEAEKNFTVVKEHIEQQGSVDVLSLKSYLIGPSCVGKTTTRRRLTGEIEHLSPDEVVPSTGIDAPVTVQVHELYRSIEQCDVLITEEWKSQCLEAQCQALCSYILNIEDAIQQEANNVQENSIELIPSASTELSPVLMKSHSVEATSKKREDFVPTISAEPVHVHVSDTESTDDESPSPSGHSIVSPRPRQDDKEDEFTSELRSLIENRDWKGIRKFLTSDKFTLLHIIDIGGQPEFHEILPLLLHGQAINLIFLDMSQDMNSPYEVTYRGSNPSRDGIIKYTSVISVREVIESTLSSISSLQSNNSAPAAILVGTHRDMCSEEKVSDLEKSVRQSFENFISSDVLCPVNNKPPARYIHEVNNVSGVSDIVKLRELITKIVHSKRFNPKPVPTSTLLLHLILRKKFNPTPGWCSLKKCIEIAAICGISEEHLTEKGGILQYLHDSFGTILYYQGKSKKLKISQRVIVNPNVIMRPPVELVVTAFGAEGNEEEEAKRIRFTGEIRHYLMERACKPSDDKKESIPTDEIVELLESQYILHELEDAKSAADGEKVYFLPCLLSSDEGVVRQSQNRSHLNDLTYAPILLIPLNKKHIPPGLFPATIVKLSQHWKLFQTKFQNDAKQTRFRNRIRFIFKGELEVELRALSTHLEFRILHDDPKPIKSRLILECRSELEEYFDEVLHSLHHTREWKWEFGFYCPRAMLSDNILPHPACCSKPNEPEKVTCPQSECGHAGLVDLEDKHMCWFTVSLNTPTCSDSAITIIVMLQFVTDLLYNRLIASFINVTS